MLELRNAAVTSGPIRYMPKSSIPVRRDWDEADASAPDPSSNFAWPPSADDLSAVEFIPLDDVATRPPASLAAEIQPPSAVIDGADAAGDGAFASEDDLSDGTTVGPVGARWQPFAARRIATWGVGLGAAAMAAVLALSSATSWRQGPGFGHDAAYSSSLPRTAAVVAGAPETTDAADGTVGTVVTERVEMAATAEHVPVDAVPSPSLERVAEARAPSAPLAHVSLALPATEAASPDVAPTAVSRRSDALAVAPPDAAQVLVPDTRVPAAVVAASALLPAQTVAVAVPTPMAPGPTRTFAPSSAAAGGNAADTETPPSRMAVTVPAVSDEVLVRGALRRYEVAYGRLDAQAAKAVWPSVNARALARAFDGLESQTLRFERCEFDVQGSVANAACRGQATYVPRVGSKTPRTEPREWSFRLRKVNEDWQILGASIR